MKMDFNTGGTWCRVGQHYSKFKKRKNYLIEISGQNKSEACKPEEAVKITNGFLRMEIFNLAGNSNQLKKIEL